MEGAKVIMKKLLLGICGVGYGHINRERQIINHLLKYDVELVLAVVKKNYSQFLNWYPELKILVAPVPKFYLCENGIDFKATLSEYKKSGMDYYGEFLKFALNVQRAFSFQNPDSVLTDYEHNVAQFAYATNVPLYCFEQHSKFLSMRGTVLGDTSADKDNFLLEYFFPKAEKRYAASFFKFDDDKLNNVEYIPPIFKEIVCRPTDNKKVVVYFSPYSKDYQEYKSVLWYLKERTSYEFYIYTELSFPEYENVPIFHFKKIGDDFDQDLADCNFIVSTAGHQLISESINLEIPMLLFPLNTFDQHYCSYVVEKENLGMQLDLSRYSDFDRFVLCLEKYRSNIKKYKEANWTASWKEILFNKLERDIGIKQRK